MTASPHEPLSDSLPSPTAPSVIDLLRELGIVANESMSVRTTLYVALDVIGRSLGWLLGRIVVGGPAFPAAGESLTLEWFNRHVTATNPCSHWPLAPRYGPDNSSSPVIVEDLAQEGHVDGCDRPLRSYVAFPIQVGAQSVGVIEFYTSESIQVSAELAQVLGHATALLGLVIERGQAQHNLRESERRFRAIFEQSYHFMALLALDGTIVEANQTALQLGNLAPDDVAGKKLWDGEWWRGSRLTQDELRLAVARATRGEPVHYTLEAQGEDGLMTLDFSIKPIRTQRGEIALLIAEGRDVTELRQSLERLRLAEARLEEAQYVAQMGHWDYDLVTEQAFWSDTLYPVFGLDPETTTEPGKEFMERIHPDDLEEVQALLVRAYEARRGYEHNYRLIRPDGSVRSVFGAGNVVVNEAGEVVRITGIIQDVTNRKRLEESLARSVERLSRINAMGQAVAASFDLEEIFDQIMSATRTLLDADVVALFVHEHGRLQVQALEHKPELKFGDVSMPTGDGVAGWAWTMGRPVWLKGEECRRRRSERLARASGYEPGAIIAVPVRWQEEVLGILEAVDRREDAFDDEDMEALQAIATWTAIAIGKARQQAALERRLRESEVIAELSRVVSETLEPQPVLDLIAATVLRVVPGTYWAVIHLLRGRPERLFPVAWAGEPLPADGYHLDPDEGLAGLVLRRGEAMSSDDAEADPRASEYARHLGLHSLVVAPIQSRSRMVGTITIVAREANAFTADDVRLATILAAQAGMSIENAQLFDSQRRARAVAEMQRERLRELTQRIVTTQEDERMRISRELHDEAGQALTSLKISLDLLRAGLPPEQETLRSRLADVASLADGTMETLRTLAHDLRPPGLDAFGLNVALEGLCYDFSTRTAMPIRYRGVELPGLPTAVALSMYRLVQEALTNIIKHAEARQTTVTLSRDDTMLELTIADDGRGFQLEPDASGRNRAGIGLISMHERAELLGGTMTIDTAPGHGTTLTARIPIEVASDGEPSPANGASS